MSVSGIYTERTALEKPVARTWRRTNGNGRSEALGLHFAAVEDIAALRADWLGLEIHATQPFQTWRWARAWLGGKPDGRRRRVVIAGFNAANRCRLILPLEITRHGLFTVAASPGRGHGTYNALLTTPDTADLIAQAGPEGLIDAIAGLLRGVDVLALYALPETLAGRPNPLLAIESCRRGRCSSHTLLLREDWTALYKAHRGSKTRAHHRRQERGVNEFGGAVHQIARSQEERLKMLKTLLAQKNAALKARGLPPLVRDKATADAYRRLVMDGEKGFTPFVSALNMRGEITAANFGLIYRNCFFGLVMAMDPYGPMDKLSPGDMLLRRTLEHCCKKGLSRVDFGAGDDPYKQSWSDRELKLYTAIIPVTLKGKAYGLALEAAMAALSAAPAFSVWLKKLRGLLAR